MLKEIPSSFSICLCLLSHQQACTLRAALIQQGDDTCMPKGFSIPTGPPYLSTPHQHLPRGHNCVPPMVWPGTPRGCLPPLCSSRHPSRWQYALAQTKLCQGLRLPPHSPAACTRLQHHSCPSRHHTRFPTVACGALRLSQRRNSSHSPVVVPQDLEKKINECTFWKPPSMSALLTEII